MENTMSGLSLPIWAREKEKNHGLGIYESMKSFTKRFQIFQKFLNCGQ